MVLRILDLGDGDAIEEGISVEVDTIEMPVYRRNLEWAPRTGQRSGR
jgi:hypothetical protein